MRITVSRIIESAEETLSRISVDGSVVCWGLEDQWQAAKVAQETRIPAGLYRVGARTHGGFHQRYARRFPWHNGMLEIRDVPGFTDILIHIGNTDADTAGCLLVGFEPDITDDGRLRVLRSAEAYARLYQAVIADAQMGALEIEFVDCVRVVRAPPRPL